MSEKFTILTYFIKSLKDFMNLELLGLCIDIWNYKHVIIYAPFIAVLRQKAKRKQTNKASSAEKIEGKWNEQVSVE